MVTAEAALALPVLVLVLAGALAAVAVLGGDHAGLAGVAPVGPGHGQVRVLSARSTRASSADTIESPVTTR